MTPLLYGLILFALLGALLLSAVGYRRLQPVGAQRAGSLWRAMVAPLARRVRPKGRRLARLQALLAQAGRDGTHAVDRSIEETVAGGLLGSLVGGIAARAIGGELGLLAFALCAISGVVAARRVLLSRAATRRAAITRALPATLDLVMTAVDAGLSLEQAIARVAEGCREGAPVLAEELSQVVRECEAGVPLTEALNRLARRVQIEEITDLCRVIAQAQELGAPIVRTLAEHAENARLLHMAQLEERSARLVAKLTLPLVFCLLPAALLAILGPAGLQLAQILAE